MLRLLGATATCVALLGALPASAAVTATLHAGTTCMGASSANFQTSGAAVKVTLCISTTAEALCGISYRFRAANAGEANRFSVTARAITGSSYNEVTNAAMPGLIGDAPSTGDLGASPNPLAPVAAGSNQFVATLDITPQASATNASYVISLDAPFSLALVDQDGACGANLTDPTESAVTASFTLNLAAPPAFTSANTATFTVASPGTFTVAASGTPTPTLAHTMGALPSGVTFNTGTGELSGTPALGTVGTFPLTFTASNGIGSPATQNFSLVVQKANQAITFNDPADRNQSAGGFSVSASSNSTLPVTLASQTTAVCTGSGTSPVIISPVAGGACVIRATQAGNANYNEAAFVEQSVQITDVGSPGTELEFAL